MTLLKEIRSTKREAPIRVAIHGDGGRGKSTFAAAAPSPIFIAPEDGLVNIDAKAFPEPKDWATLIAQVESLVDGDHPYKTLVIDSLDWAEPLCWARVCEKGDAKGRKVRDIESFGYGKGYIAALDEWRVLLSRLSAVRARGMNIVLIAHSVRKTVKNPEGDDYEQWQMKIHEKAAGLIKEWVDVVGFAVNEVHTVESDTGRVKGVATGRFLLKTKPAAGYDGKTRFDMPAELPLDWQTFADSVKSGGVANAVTRLNAELDAKLAELGDAEVEKSARAFIKQRGATVASLTQAIAAADKHLSERKKAG